MTNVLRLLHASMPLLVRYAAAGAFGYASEYLWTLAGIDAPGNLSRFYLVAIPVCYALFSTAYAIMLRPGGDEQAAFCRCRDYDDATYLLLLGFLGIEIVAPALPAPYLVCSALYLVMVCAKAAIWCGGVWRNIAAQPESGGAAASQRLHRMLVITAVVVYALISWYHYYRFTTTGDEPHYLLITHSLWHDGDTNLFNNYRDKDYASFYWDELQPAFGDQVNETTIYSYRHKGVYPHTLLPGYALGGRFGATLQMNLIAALLMGQVFLLAGELFHSLRAAFMTWLVMAFTVPLIVYMGQIYPETLAALLAIWIVRLIRNLPEEQLWRSHRFWRDCAWIAGGLLLLVLLKTRYLPLAGTLILFFLLRVIQRKSRLTQKLLFVAGMAGVFVLLGLVAVLADRYLLGGMFLARISDSRYMSWIMKGYNPLSGLFGLLFDQEYGLLFYAPLYLLAFIGAGLLSRADLAQTLPLLLLVGINHLVIALWPLWHAAPTPPARYLLPVIPLVGVCMTAFWKLPTSAAKYVMAGVSAFWSACAAWTMTLNPWWRYNWADGTNNFLEELLSSRLSIDLVRIFPSYMRPTDHIVVLTAACLAAIGGIIAVFRRERFRQPQTPSLETALPLALVATATLLFGGGLIAKQRPTLVIEAEDRLNIGARDGQRVPSALDPWDNQQYLREYRYFGWRLEANQRMTIFPKLPRPSVTITIYARSRIHHKTPENLPILHIFSKTDHLASLNISSSDWQPYAVPLLMNMRRPELTFKVETPDPADGVIIDKFRFQ